MALIGYRVLGVRYARRSSAVFCKDHFLKFATAFGGLRRSARTDGIKVSELCFLGQVENKSNFAMKILIGLFKAVPAMVGWLAGWLVGPVAPM